MADDPTLEDQGLFARQVWTFGRCVFDESRRELTVDGAPVELETKPLDLLLELLRHAGEVVTKEELLDAVWAGVTVAEGSLTTAVSKLRKVLGEGVLATVPRIGYRLDGPVSSRPTSRPAVRPLPIEPGAALPDRPNWRYVERLHLAAGGEVWRVRHTKTGEERVLKYALEGARLQALKREVAVMRLLRGALGERPDLAPLIDWNFERAPYQLETGYGGLDLERWVDGQGGFAAIPLGLRLEIVASVASTLAAAHGVAVLHKDVKPMNIVLAPALQGGWSVKLVDFGSAGVSARAQLQAFQITDTAFTWTEGEQSRGTGAWLAPEVLEGGAPSTASDVYALGVVLYQMVAGDLRRVLAAGWEAEIADPLLREDVALACAGDPARRLGSAAELAERLRSLSDRRRERDARALAAARAQAAEARLERERARRPWVIAAGVILATGLVATTGLALEAARERDAARRQTAVADETNRFLASDLLARSNPFRSTSAVESVADAVKQAAPLIDARFPHEPAVAARLHQTVANALDKRSDWAAARGEYDRARALWIRAEGPRSQDGVEAELQEAMMEPRTGQGGGIAKSKALIADAQARLDGVAHPRPDIPVWLHSAKGMAALLSEDLAAAEPEFAQAVASADRLPGFDPSARLTFRQRLAFTRMRKGDGAGAEAGFRSLARDFAALEGEQGPNVLMVKMNIAQTLMVQGRHAEAIAQANAIKPELDRRLGPDHEMSLQLVTTRAQSEGVLERWDDAIRDDLAVHDAAVRKQGPKSFFAIASLSDAATAQCRGGHLAEGLKNAAQAWSYAKSGFGPSALTDATAYTVAACEIALGRYDAAAGHLTGIDAARVAQLASDPNWGANLDLARAQIALAGGDRESARRLLTSSAQAFALPTAEPYQARAWKLLNRRLSDRG